MKKLISLILSVLISTNAYALGNMLGGGSGHRSEEYKGGVDAFGIHIDGEGGVDITFSECEDPNATADMNGVCKCNSGYVAGKDENGKYKCVQSPCAELIESYGLDGECVTCTESEDGSPKVTTNDKNGALCGKGNNFTCQAGRCQDPCENVTPPTCQKCVAKGGVATYENDDTNSQGCDLGLVCINGVCAENCDPPRIWAEIETSSGKTRHACICPGNGGEVGGWLWGLWSEKTCCMNGYTWNEGSNSYTSGSEQCCNHEDPKGQKLWQWFEWWDDFEYVDGHCCYKGFDSNPGDVENSTCCNAEGGKVVGGSCCQPNGNTDAYDLWASKENDFHSQTCCSDIQRPFMCDRRWRDLEWQGLIAIGTIVWYALDPSLTIIPKALAYWLLIDEGEWKDMPVRKEVEAIISLGTPDDHVVCTENLKECCDLNKGILCQDPNGKEICVESLENGCCPAGMKESNGKCECIKGVLGSYGEGEDAKLGCCEEEKLAHKNGGVNECCGDKEEPKQDENLTEESEKCCASDQLNIDDSCCNGDKVAIDNNAEKPFTCCGDGYVAHDVTKEDEVAPPEICCPKDTDVNVGGDCCEEGNVFTNDEGTGCCTDGYVKGETGAQQCCTNETDEVCDGACVTPCKENEKRNPNSCECECTGEEPEGGCEGAKRWNAKSCTCKCPSEEPAEGCGYGKEWDEEDCACKCLQGGTESGSDSSVCCKDGYKWSEIAEKYVWVEPQQCSCPKGGKISDKDETVCCSGKYQWNSFSFEYDIEATDVCGCPDEPEEGCGNDEAWNTERCRCEKMCSETETSYCKTAANGECTEYDCCSGTVSEINSRGFQTCCDTKEKKAYCSTVDPASTVCFNYSCCDGEPSPASENGLQQCCAEGETPYCEGVLSGQCVHYECCKGTPSAADENGLQHCCAEGETPYCYRRLSSSEGCVEYGCCNGEPAEQENGLETCCAANEEPYCSIARNGNCIGYNCCAGTLTEQDSKGVKKCCTGETVPVGTKCCASDKVATNNGVKTCCEDDQYVKGKENAELCCENDTDEVCKNVCYEECPSGKTRNTETCECECPKDKPEMCNETCYASCADDEIRNPETCECEEEELPFECPEGQKAYCKNTELADGGLKCVEYDCCTGKVSEKDSLDRRVCCETGNPYCEKLNNFDAHSCMEHSCCSGEPSEKDENGLQSCCENGKKPYCELFYAGKCNKYECCDGEPSEADANGAQYCCGEEKPYPYCNGGDENGCYKYDCCSVKPSQPDGITKVQSCCDKPEKPYSYCWSVGEEGCDNYECCESAEKVYRLNTKYYDCCSDGELTQADENGFKKCCEGDKPVVVGTECCAEGKVATNNGVKTCCGDKEYVRGEENAQLCCTNETDEVCNNTCYEKCPDGQTRNTETCECGCPTDKPEECNGTCYAPCADDETRNKETCECEEEEIPYTCPEGQKPYCKYTKVVDGEFKCVEYDCCTGTLSEKETIGSRRCCETGTPYCERFDEGLEGCLRHSCCSVEPSEKDENGLQYCCENGKKPYCELSYAGKCNKYECCDGEPSEADANGAQYCCGAEKPYPYCNGGDENGCYKYDCCSVKPSQPDGITKVQSCCDKPEKPYSYCWSVGEEGCDNYECCESAEKVYRLNTKYYDCCSDGELTQADENGFKKCCEGDKPVAVGTECCASDKVATNNGVKTCCGDKEYVKGEENAELCCANETDEVCKNVCYEKCPDGQTRNTENCECENKCKEDGTDSSGTATEECCTKAEGNWHNGVCCSGSGEEPWKDMAGNYNATCCMLEAEGNVAEEGVCCYQDSGVDMVTDQDNQSCCEYNQKAWVNGNCCDSGKVATNNDVKTCCGDEEHVKGEENAELCCTNDTDEVCNNTCHEKCPDGQTRNAETCECECPADKPEVCNGTCYAKCPDGQKRNSETCECENCPADKPEVCNGECYAACPADQIRSSETCECKKTCPDGGEPSTNPEYPDECCKNNKLWNPREKDYTYVDSGICGCPDGGEPSKAEGEAAHFCCKGGYGYASWLLEPGYDVVNAEICGCPLEGRAVGTKCCSNEYEINTDTKKYDIKNVSLCGCPDGKTKIGNDCCENANVAGEGENAVCCSGNEDGKDKDGNINEQCCTKADGTYEADEDSPTCCTSGSENDIEGNGSSVCCKAAGREWSDGENKCCDEGEGTYTKDDMTYCCTSKDDAESCCTGEEAFWKTGEDGEGKCCANDTDEICNNTCYEKCPDGQTRDENCDCKATCNEDGTDADGNVTEECCNDAGGVYANNESGTACCKSNGYGASAKGMDDKINAVCCTEFQGEMADEEHCCASNGTDSETWTETETCCTFAGAIWDDGKCLKCEGAYSNGVVENKCCEKLSEEGGFDEMCCYGSLNVGTGEDDERCCYGEGKELTTSIVTETCCSLLSGGTAWMNGQGTCCATSGGEGYELNGGYVEGCCYGDYVWDFDNNQCIYCNGVYDESGEVSQKCCAKRGDEGNFDTACCDGSNNIGTGEDDAQCCNSDGTDKSGNMSAFCCQNAGGALDNADNPTVCCQDAWSTVDGEENEACHKCQETEDGVCKCSDDYTEQDGECCKDGMNATNDPVEACCEGTWNNGVCCSSSEDGKDMWGYQSEECCSGNYVTYVEDNTEKYVCCSSNNDGTDSDGNAHEQCCSNAGGSYHDGVCCKKTEDEQEGWKDINGNYDAVCCMWQTSGNATENGACCLQDSAVDLVTGQDSQSCCEYYEKEWIDGMCFDKCPDGSTGRSDGDPGVCCGEGGMISDRGDIFDPSSTPNAELCPCYENEWSAGTACCSGVGVDRKEGKSTENCCTAGSGWWNSEKSVCCATSYGEGYELNGEHIESCCYGDYKWDSDNNECVADKGLSSVDDCPDGYRRNNSGQCEPICGNDAVWTGVLTGPDDDGCCPTARYNGTTGMCCNEGYKAENGQCVRDCGDDAVWTGVLTGPDDDGCCPTARYNGTTGTCCNEGYKAENGQCVRDCGDDAVWVGFGTSADDDGCCATARALIELGGCCPPGSIADSDRGACSFDMSSMSSHDCEGNGVWLGDRCCPTERYAPNSKLCCAEGYKADEDGIRCVRDCDGVWMVDRCCPTERYAPVSQLCCKEGYKAHTDGERCVIDCSDPSNVWDGESCCPKESYAIITGKCCSEGFISNPSGTACMPEE